MIEPDKVTVIVHQAKNIQGKKKGRHKFSVVFGVGRTKFQTDVVEDLFGAPTWNTEATIAVENASEPLKFLLKEKDDTLGQIKISLAELPMERPSHYRTLPLQPHKKSPSPRGELSLSVWVSATRSPRQQKASPGGTFQNQLKKVKDRISHSPMLGRKHRTPEPSPLSGRHAMSVGDISSLHRHKTNLLSVPSDSMSSLSSTDSDTNRMSASCHDLVEEVNKSEVSGISPKEGPVEGGTRLTIRGINLGTCQDDLIAVYVCGANCINNVEYVSSSKLFCTTLPWKVGSGEIAVETKSGGKGTSMVRFSFVNKNAKPPASPVLQQRPASIASFETSASLKPVPAIITPPNEKNSPGPSPNLKLKGLKRNPSDASLRSNHSGSSMGVICEEGGKPEITGISPRDGPTEGGTKVTIRGKNFGTCRNDITALFVCGMSCLATMEWESPQKIFCISKPMEAMTGDIVLETKQGGRGVSLVQFTYYQKKTLSADSVEVHMQRGSSFDEFGTDFDLADLKPEVTGISPKDGPQEGGTRLTIRGINLGQDHEDILGLYVCGADCLSTLQYESSMKLHCVTKPWRPCNGEVMVQTRSGGVGSSLINFTYLASKKKAGVSPLGRPPSGREPLTTSPAVLSTEPKIAPSPLSTEQTYSAEPEVMKEVQLETDTVELEQAKAEQETTPPRKPPRKPKSPEMSSQLINPFDGYVDEFAPSETPDDVFSSMMPQPVKAESKNTAKNPFGEDDMFAAVPYPGDSSTDPDPPKNTSPSAEAVSPVLHPSPSVSPVTNTMNPAQFHDSPRNSSQFSDSSRNSVQYTDSPRNSIQYTDSPRNSVQYTDSPRNSVQYTDSPRNSVQYTDSPTHSVQYTDRNSVLSFDADTDGDHRSRPDGQEMHPSPLKERKRNAPPLPVPAIESPIVVSPPPTDAAPTRRLSSQNSVEEEKKTKQENKNNRDSERKKGSLISKLTGQDKKDKQREAETAQQMQRLTEEIAKLRTENKV